MVIRDMYLLLFVFYYVLAYNKTGVGILQGPRVSLRLTSKKEKKEKKMKERTKEWKKERTKERNKERMKERKRRKFHCV